MRVDLSSEDEEKARKLLAALPRLEPKKSRLPLLRWFPLIILIVLLLVLGFFVFGNWGTLSSARTRLVNPEQTVP